MTVADYSRYYQENILVLMKLSTQRTWRSRMKHVLPGLGEQQIDKIDPTAVQKVFTQLAQAKPKSVRLVWTSLGMMLSAARDEGYDIELRRPRFPKRTKTRQPWFTMADVHAMMMLAYEDDWLIYGMLAETGMRIGELRGLQWRDVDFTERTLHINKTMLGSQDSPTKSEAGDRIIAISAPLKKLLLRHRPDDWQPDGFIFTGVRAKQSPRDAVGLYREFNDRLRVLKLHSHKKSGFHMFRRGNANLIVSVLKFPETVAAYRLGHENTGFTTSVYCNSYVGMDKDVCRLLGRVVWVPEKFMLHRSSLARALGELTVDEPKA